MKTPDPIRLPRARRAMTGPSMRHLTTMAVAILAIACLPADDASTKQDTTILPPSGASSPPAAVVDSISGVPAVPRDSVGVAAADTGSVQLWPTRPQRGGVVFAYAEGVASTIPRCAWKGSPLPCYAHGQGVLAIVPLPADEPAGTFTLSIERAGGPISRQITVADRDFGRELIFLDSTRYALLSRTRDIGRDGRAVRAVLATESPDVRWSGRWGDPVTSSKSSGYGVERFYYKASDSSRAVTVSSAARVRGSFGADTSATAGKDAPGWRHSGIDLPVAANTAVVAPAAGTVADAGDYVLTGRTLVLDHGQGVLSAYFHLDTVLVQRGDVLRKGTRIARVGATGLATGPHLHFGIYVHGKDVDPAAWRDMPPFVLSGADSTRRGTPR